MLSGPGCPVCVTDQAEIDACKIEHLLSIESSVKLAAFIQCILSDKKVANDFLKELGTVSPTCTHHAESCSICQTLCFYDTKAVLLEPKEKGI